MKLDSTITEAVYAKSKQNCFALSIASGFNNHKIELIEKDVPESQLAQREHFHIESSDSVKNGLNSLAGQTKMKNEKTYAILLTLDQESDTNVKDFIQLSAAKQNKSVASYIKALIKKEMESFIVNSDEHGKIDFKAIK